MDTREQRIDFEYLAVFGSCLVPFSLGFQRLSVEFVNLVREWCFAHQLVGSVHGQVGDRRA